jgi:hypothetical protein
MNNKGDISAQVQSAVMAEIDGFAIAADPNIIGDIRCQIYRPDTTVSTPNPYYPVIYDFTSIQRNGNSY